MKITKDALKQLIKEELNNLAEQVKPSQWLEENYVKPHLDEGYKRYDALPRDHGLVAGKTYPAVHRACAITFKDHDIVLVLDGDFSCIRGRMDVMWRVDEKEFNRLVGTEDVYAVLAKTSSTPKADLADPLEEMIREELGTMLKEAPINKMLDFKGVHALVQRRVTPRNREAIYKVTGDHDFMEGGTITINIPGSMPKLPPEGAEAEDALTEDMKEKAARSVWELYSQDKASRPDVAHPDGESAEKRLNAKRQKKRLAMGKARDDR